MVFGGIETERLQLNEDTLWAGGPYDPNHTNAAGALPEIRGLIENEHFLEAQKLISERFMGTPLTQMPYQTLGDLMLYQSFAQGEKGETSNYRRELNLETAVATTTFTKNGVVFTREVFASPTKEANVIVVKISANKPKQISVEIEMKTPSTEHSQPEIVAKSDTLVITGKNGAAAGIAGALTFQARIKVTAEGAKPIASADRVQIKNANSVTILIAMATSFKRFDDVSGNPEAITKKQIASASQVPYGTLKVNHIAEHQRLFHRVHLDLGNSSKAIAELTTNERILRKSKSDDPALFALYFQYARYLLICSSRPGTQPANLQGIWNDSLRPPWGSKYTININTEMNYWPAEVANLPECVEPLVQMVEELAETGKKTAQVHWGARGWMAHHNTDIWRATAPIDGPFWGMWPCGGAWLCRHLWEHYEFSNDKKFLARVYPLFKGAAQFFLDTLITDKKTGYLITSPSISPENGHHKDVSVCAGPTMDAQIIRDLFAFTEKAARILGKDATFQKQLKEISEKLPPNQIGKQGQLQEWLEDWDAGAPEQQHRHVSHLYGLFPSQQISVRHTPDLARAVETTLNTRGDYTTGWAIAWRINLWARLRDAERAYKILELLLESSRTYPNLFDAHPPFQIDGNFGGANGILEMLVQQDGITGEIELLPCLPSVWQEGKVQGLRLKGGFLLALSWSKGRLQEAVLTSTHGTEGTLRYQEKTQKVSLRSGEQARFTF